MMKFGKQSIFYFFFTGIFSNQWDSTGRLQAKLKLIDRCSPQRCIQSKTATWTAVQCLPASFLWKKRKGEKKAPPSFAQPADSKIARKGTAADLTIPVLRMEGGQRHSNMSSITFWGRVKDGKKYPKQSSYGDWKRWHSNMFKSMWEGKERKWLCKQERDTALLYQRNTRSWTDDFASAVTIWCH